MFTENKRTLKRPHEEDLESASHYAQGSSNNSNQTQFTVTASQMPWVTDQPHQRPLENPFLSNDPRQISGSSRFSHSGQQCQRLARNTFVTKHPVQAPVQPFEGQIWDEIFTEVEDNNAARRARTQQDPAAHAQALAKLQWHRSPGFEATYKQLFEAAQQRQASIHSHTGNDFTSRALHDIPDAFDAANLVRGEGYSLDDSVAAEGNGENREDAQNEDIQKSVTEDGTRRANRFLRLN